MDLKMTTLHLSHRKKMWIQKNVKLKTSNVEFINEVH
jgi:hypothetical protein